MGEHHHRRSECGVHARKRERLHAEIFKRSEMSRKARYESTQSAESKGKKRLGDFARGAAQAPPCTEKNDALQDPADQRKKPQKDNTQQGPQQSQGTPCRMQHIKQTSPRGETK